MSCLRPAPRLFLRILSGPCLFLFVVLTIIVLSRSSSVNGQVADQHAATTNQIDNVTSTSAGRTLPEPFALAQAPLAFPAVTARTISMQGLSPSVVVPADLLTRLLRFGSMLFDSIETRFITLQKIPKRGVA